MSEALERGPGDPPVHQPGTPFIELQSVDSTNNYARQQIHAGLAQHGMVIFTHEQVAGRGQRGRVWVSQKDMNIALSMVLDPGGLSPLNQFPLSACIAVAVHEFFSRYAIDKVSIKWPNDLYWQDRKAGGILIESVIGANSEDSDWSWAIAGIGMNINQTLFPDFLPNPVSLKQITGQDYHLIPLAKEICRTVGKYYRELVSDGPVNILRLYNEKLYKLNERVRLKKDNRVFEVRILGVTARGQLQVQHTMTEEYSFGEVEWVS